MIDIRDHGGAFGGGKTQGYIYKEDTRKASEIFSRSNLTAVVYEIKKDKIFILSSGMEKLLVLTLNGELITEVNLSAKISAYFMGSAYLRSGGVSDEGIVYVYGMNAGSNYYCRVLSYDYVTDKVVSFLDLTAQTYTHTYVGPIVTDKDFVYLPQSQKLLQINKNLSTVVSENIINAFNIATEMYYYPETDVLVVSGQGGRVLTTIENNFLKSKKQSVTSYSVRAYREVVAGNTMIVGIAEDNLFYVFQNARSAMTDDIRGEIYNSDTFTGTEKTVQGIYPSSTYTFTMAYPVTFLFRFKKNVYCMFYNHGLYTVDLDNKKIVFFDLARKFEETPNTLQYISITSFFTNIKNGMLGVTYSYRGVNFTKILKITV